MKNQTKVQMRF